MGTLEPLTVGPALANDERLIWSAQAQPKATQPNHYSLIGAVLEFDIAPQHFVSIRSVVTRQQGQWGSFADDVPSPVNNDGGNKTHVRGFWPKADLVLMGPPLECYLQAPPPAFVEFDICETGGPEATHFSAANSWAIGVPGAPPNGIAGSTDNRAAYGANLRYLLPLTNSAPVPPGMLGSAYVGIRRRSIGASKFFCAAQLDIRPSLKLQPIPLQSNPLLIGHDLTAVPLGGPVVVPPQQSVLPSLRLAVAAAAATPANIMVRRDGLWPQPVEEPN
jgi:hypothetical protein